MIEERFPILEFDAFSQPKINPSDTNHFSKYNVSDCCIISYFQSVNEEYMEKDNSIRIGCIPTAMGSFPLCSIAYNDMRIGLVQGLVGAPAAAGLLEELIAIGFTKFVAIGGCGVLENIGVGQILLPTSAIRDEGTSYHYVVPSREIQADASVTQTIEAVLNKNSIPYSLVKTWTTDAIYRETQDKIIKRREEGCKAVEMEASAYMAVAKHRKVQFGQLLYAGDDLSKDKWDSRKWQSRSDVQHTLIEIAMEVSASLISTA